MTKITQKQKACCCCLILGTFIACLLLGNYLPFTILPKPMIPSGAIAPSIHTADNITINGEKIYYNGTLFEGKVINLTVGHQTPHAQSPYQTMRSLIGLVLKTQGSLAVWDNDNVKITSFGRTIGNPQGQQWFTPEHTHNPGASWNSWRDNIALFGQVPTANFYVNKKNQIQTEVGIDYVSINVTGNSAKEVYTLTVAQIHRELSSLWLNYLISIPVLSLLLYYVVYREQRYVGGAYGQAEVNKDILMTAKWWSFRRIMLYGSVFYEFAEFFKDVIYLVCFPHTSHFNVYILLLALFAYPYTLVYGLWMSYDADYPLVGNAELMCLGFRPRHSESNTFRKCCRAVVFSTLQIGIFSQELLELGCTWKSSWYFFPVISWITIAVSCGKSGTTAYGEYHRRRFCCSILILFIALCLTGARIFLEFSGTQKILDQAALRNPMLAPASTLLVSFWILPAILAIQSLCLTRNSTLKQFSGRLRTTILHFRNAGYSTLDYQSVFQSALDSDLYGEEFKDNEECKKLAEDVLMKLDVLKDEERGKFFEELLKLLP